ncbi:MAG: ATP phosphoribosyltransferase regulatory subunit [Sphingomonadales bacterium]
MAETDQNGLLPEGLRDALPPEAAHEEALARRLADLFAVNGYERVTPPLIEFEDSLLARLDDASRLDMFRLLDPESQRVMALRSDLTGQVARIAATRLAHWPRPLRLSYAGTALRVKGSQLRPERQFRQVGLELIGPGSHAAVIEVLGLAQAALALVPIAHLSIDLVVPGFIAGLCQELDLNADETAQARAALDAKDVGALAGLSGRAQALLVAVLDHAGDATGALAALGGLDLPPKSAALVADLAALAAAWTARPDAAALTVDLGEFRGFAYQHGLGFTLYARGVRGELGRGGRYSIRRADGGHEAATGLTLYMDSITRAAPAPDPTPRLWLPQHAPADQAARWQGEGYVTVRALDADADPVAEAKRLRCSHYWQDGAVLPVSA